MKWVEIFNTHINTNLLETFTWYQGELRLTFTGLKEICTVQDPDRAFYVKLCSQLGVRPVEADDHEKE